VRPLKRNEIITYVKLNNIENKAIFTVLKGDIDTRLLILRAQAQFGKKLSICVEVYVSAAPAITTPSQTIVKTITNASDGDVTAVTNVPGGAD
jgi:hypothetical protein